MVVHEHRFEIRLGPWSDFIFREGAERVALVRTLIIVGRIEVVTRTRGKGRKRSRAEPSYG